MSNTNEQTEKKHENIKIKKVKSAISIGLSAGFIWGFLSLLAYYLQFTNVGPSIYAKAVLNPDYMLKWQGHLIGIVFFHFFTLILAFIYVFLFTRFKTAWGGIIYGFAWWIIVFYLLNPIFHLTKPVKELGFNTNSVMICLYILIGLFIGYSLSVEFNSEDK